MTDETIKDPAFPGLHIRPQHGWVNDPNGLALIDGRYHVFFQHNPDQPLHRSVKWGHASSTDLINWEYHPTALTNRPGTIDEAGCWSGCVVDDHGVPTAVYTAVRDRPSDAVVALARSDRELLTWQQSDRGVIGPPADRRLIETRDPYVFNFGDHRYAVQGTGGPDAEPAILLYGCDDLEAWSELGVLLDYRDPLVREAAESVTWECPNLFPLDGSWVLLLACWQHGDLASIYLVGELEPSGDGLRFVARAGGHVDDSPVFYAPQVMVTAERVLIWGWARDIDRSEVDRLRAGWAGALTFPRALSLESDRLVSTPVAELESLRAGQLPADQPITERSFELRSDSGLTVELVDNASRLVVDEPGAVRVLVDGSVIEIFPHNGTPRTVRAYPSAISAWQVRTAASDAVRIDRLALPQ